MSATIDCTPNWEMGALALVADNINAEHDNSNYMCSFTLEMELV